MRLVHHRERKFFFFGILLIMTGIVIGYVIAQNNQPKVSHTVDQIEGFRENVTSIVKEETPKLTILNNLGVDVKKINVSCDKSGKWVTVTDKYLVLLPKQTKNLNGVIRAKTTPICCSYKTIGGIQIKTCSPCENQNIYYRKIRYRLKRWSEGNWVYTDWSEAVDFDTSNTNKWSIAWWVPLTLQNLGGDYYWWVEIQIKADLPECGAGFGKYEKAQYVIGGMHLHAET